MNETTNYPEIFRRSMKQENYNYAYQLVMTLPEVAAIVRAEDLVKLQKYLNSVGASRKKKRILDCTVRQELNRIKLRLETTV